jgi:hypothetical protein
MSFPQWTPGQENPEVPVNEAFDILDHTAVYGRDPDSTSGLTWGYLGGRWSGLAVTPSTLTLTDAATNYVVVKRSDGVISTSTSTTNWNDLAQYARVFKLTTAGGVVTAVEDHRAGDGGILGSGSSAEPTPPTAIPQNAQSADYTLVIGDAGKHLLHPTADTTARVFTIPANASVAFGIGTTVTFVNQAGAGVVTIAITTDTMRLAGTGTTGSRTLAANGIATALKLTSTEWIISGMGLT